MKASLRRICILLAAPIVLVFAAAFILWIYTLFLQWGLDERLPPPGRMVNIGTHALHIDCRGEGAPTVVLEAGASSWSTHWERVQTLMSEQTRVCSYDRAGLGWSEAGPTPRDPEVLARELDRLLRAAGESPPFVLIGTSYGGNIAWQFAQIFPQQTAGLVTVETPDIEFMAWRRSLRFIPSDTHIRIFRPLLTILMAASEVLFRRDMDQFPWQHFSSQAKIVMSDVAFRSRMKPGLLRERNDPENMGEMRPLQNDIPLVVVQGVNSQFGSPEWDAAQQRLLSQANRGQLFRAEDGTHIVHMERPEVLVEALRYILRTDTPE